MQPILPSRLDGAWDGSWQSERNGHHGRLRCLMTPTTEQEYRAHFDARFWKVLRYSYSVPLHVARAGEAFEFEGSADLGWLAGGLYSYRGHADGTNFFATYESAHDHGTFTMARPRSSE